MLPLKSLIRSLSVFKKNCRNFEIGKKYIFPLPIEKLSGCQTSNIVNLISNYISIQLNKIIICTLMFQFMYNYILWYENMNGPSEDGRSTLWYTIFYCRVNNLVLDYIMLLPDTLYTYNIYDIEAHWFIWWIGVGPYVSQIYH